MPLKLNLAIPNKAVHAFIGLIVLTVIASGVYAYIVLPGSTPNPGHALSTIQGFFQGDASLLDSLGKVQQEVSGACPGQVIVGINADGTVSCEADDTGTGDITDVLSGVGTKGGASSGPATIEFDCSEVSGSGITCSGEDLQVNTGATSTTGLEIVSDQVRLMNDGCAAGEILKRNAGNTGWECVADETGTGGGVEFGGMYAICCNGACPTPNPATGACSCPAGFLTSSIPFTIALQGCGGPPCGTQGTIRFCSR